MRSFEESATELAKRLADEQAELSRNVQELSSHAAAIMRSFEDSTAEMTKKLAEEQAELSRNAGDRVEQELNSRSDLIMRTFEKSAADIARKLFEEQLSLSRTAAENAGQELSSRAAAIIRSFEDSTVEMEGRIDVSRAATVEVLTRSQSLQKEINDGMLPLQQALQQLHDSNRDGIEKLQSQAVSEINRRAAQFEDRLDMISSERAIGFAAEIESRLNPSQQQADELLERIGAVFQLLQSTARVQQERLIEHSKATAVNFEQEIRSILLRFAGGSQL
jgi:DNA anti-recombination protein RmuC